MDGLKPIRLIASIPSREDPDHLHEAGTAGVLVEHLGSDAYLVELRVPDGSLEGDAWYETVEVYAHEFEMAAGPER